MSENVILPLPKALLPMQRERRWLLWRRVGEGKVPKQPDRSPGKHNDPDTWSSFARVVRAYESDLYFDGIGFVPGPEIAGVDIDKCFHDGKLMRWARDLIALTDSYIEVSPSGNGLRTWGRSTKEHLNVSFDYATGKIEIAAGDDCRKYLTVPGNMFRPCRALTDIDPFIDHCLSLRPKSAHRCGATTKGDVKIGTPSKLTPEQIVRKHRLRGMLVAELLHGAGQEKGKTKGGYIARHRLHWKMACWLAEEGVPDDERAVLLWHTAWAADYGFNKNSLWRLIAKTRQD
jgi:hypothetical protein